MNHIRFDWPDLPPSVNGLYVVVRGRKILSTKGKAWKNAFISGYGGADRQAFMQFQADPNAMYSLDLWFYISQESLFNIGWGVDKRVQSPFADMDVDNLVKVTADAISTLVGIRDRNNFDISQHKRVADVRGPLMVAILKPLDLLQEGP